MSEIILLEYKVAVEGLKSEMKSVQTELKATEKAGVDSAKKTEEAFKKTENSTKSLKAQLRELKAQLASATDPKDIERLAKAAGALTDQLEDAGDAAKIFSSESKFEQVGNAIGSIGGKLRNLDFKGAADQAKLLVSVVQSFSVKDVIDGVKDLGSAFVNIGKALLTNPLFLAAAAIVAIGLAIKDLIETEQAQDQALADNIVSLRKVTEATNDLKKVNRDLALQNRIDAGEISKQNGEKIKNQNKYVDDVLKINKEQYEAEKELRETFDKIKDDDGFKGSKKVFEALGGELSATKQNKKGLLGIQNEFDKKRKELLVSFNEGDKKIQIEVNNDKKKIAEDESKKLIEEQKKENDRILKEAESLQRALRDLRLKNIENDYDREKQSLFNKFEDDKRQYHGDVEIQKELAISLSRDLLKVDDKFFEEKIKPINLFEEKKKDIEDMSLKNKLDNGDKQLKAVIDIGDKEIEVAKKVEEEKKQIQQASIQFIQQGISAINEINQNNIASEIESVQQSNDTQVAILDEQLKRKEITQAQYDKKKSESDKKAYEEEKKLKIKAFTANKQASTISAIINTAQAVTSALTVAQPAGFLLAALAAASGALQIAVIESQPTPKFAKGVVNLKGKGTGTSDEIHAMLSKGESVVTSKATNEYSGLLHAMNKNQAANFIKEFYIAPALKTQQKKFESEKKKGFADSLMQSFALNSGKLNDGNLLDSLKMIRKNDKEIAHYIVKELKSNGNNPRSW